MTASPAATESPTPTATADVRRQPSNNYGIYERIKFAAGANKARVSDAVATGTVNGYVFGVSAGQVLHLTVTVQPGECEWEVFGRDDQKLNPASSSAAGQIGGSHFTEQYYRLVGGDQLIVMSRGPGGCSYDMDVEIN